MEFQELVVFLALTALIGSLMGAATLWLTSYLRRIRIRRIVNEKIMPFNLGAGGKLQELKALYPELDDEGFKLLVKPLGQQTGRVWFAWVYEPKTAEAEEAKYFELADELISAREKELAN